ncbi:MAG: hypothetical protein EBS86_09860, partial [Crocinitomicaceae bacterium]|nr:hypothetical protein [Crocinitomicaceae bacterium]
MIKTKFCLLLLIFVVSFSAKANLRPCFLTVTLNASKTKFTTTELVQLNVILTNSDFESHSILIPG